MLYSFNQHLAAVYLIFVNTVIKSFVVQNLSRQLVLILCQSELPEAEQDNGGSTESVKEQEMKWTDLALQSLHENTPSSGS